MAWSEVGDCPHNVFGMIPSENRTATTVMAMYRSVCMTYPPVLGGVKLPVASVTVTSPRLYPPPILFSTSLAGRAHQDPSPVKGEGPLTSPSEPDREGEGAPAPGRVAC